MPDSAEYGDVGSNTLVNTARAVGGLNLPNLESLGLGNIASIEGVSPRSDCCGCFGIMLEKSKGKDTIIGHWEIAGIITEQPFPTYPQGFPPEIIKQFEEAIGRETIGNYPASGTEIINELGEEHIRTGKPIVYTSADSVFQIAAHEDIIPVNELYEMCQKARKILVGEHNVARVIARPFVGSPGNFMRTDRRKDFSVPPPSPTILDALSNAGYEVVSIGKICDIFANQGVTKSIHILDNLDGIEKTFEAIQTSKPGLIFTNLIDFDTVWGHRNDPKGFAFGLRQFDEHLPRLQSAMEEKDILILTADHGNDPTTPSTDHSREKVPLLVWSKKLTHCVDLGTRQTFADIAATIADFFELKPWPVGTSFAKEILP
jgi:phosphopentomutase